LLQIFTVIFIVSFVSLAGYWFWYNYYYEAEDWSKYTEPDDDEIYLSTDLSYGKFDVGNGIIIWVGEIPTMDQYRYETYVHRFDIEKREYGRHDINLDIYQAPRIYGEHSILETSNSYRDFIEIYDLELGVKSSFGADNINGADLDDEKVVIHTVVEEEYPVRPPIYYEKKYVQQFILYDIETREKKEVVTSCNTGIFAVKDDHIAYKLEDRTQPHGSVKQYEVHLYDIATNKTVMIHNTTEEIRRILIEGDDLIWVEGTNYDVNKTLYLYSLDENREHKHFEIGKNVSIDFDGRYIVWVEGGIHQYDLQEDVTTTIPGTEDAVIPKVDGRYIVYSSEFRDPENYYGNNYDHLNIYDRETGEIMKLLRNKPTWA